MNVWSIERFFFHFNFNGGDKIDADEAKSAKNSVFNGFIVEEGMTLESFEAKNADVYKNFEQNETADIRKYLDSVLEKFEAVKQKGLDKLKSNY